MSNTKYDTNEWYNLMEEWSENAACAGDIETMIIAEIAMHGTYASVLDTMDAGKYALNQDAEQRIAKVRKARNPRLAACKIMEKII